VYSASSGKYVLVTVHPKRGKKGMDATGVLPAFAGIAVHDARAPYDGYAGAAAHALCNAHILRKLTAVTETGTEGDVIWARQPIDALLALKQAADAARTAGHSAIDPEILDKQSRWFRQQPKPGSSSTPPAAASSSASAAPSPPGCSPAATTTSDSPMTCGSRSTTIKPSKSPG
jgi:hypothetical protein